MIRPFINNEYKQLKKVVLGISDDFGGCPVLNNAYDPKSKENILNGTFPNEIDIKKELNGFMHVLKKYNVDVIRPNNIFNCNQIFSRDVGFVIQDKFFVSNMISKRKEEILGFEFILKQINTISIENIPKNISVEGGDVIVGNDYLFIGYSNQNDFDKYEVSRTNKEAINFFSEHISEKKVIGLELCKSDHDPRLNCLHLDCCFQPLGLGHVLLYPDGFKSSSDVLLIQEIFGSDNIILIDRDEMYNMFCNVFSIDFDVVVSEKKFTRLNNVLRSKGYTIEEIEFSEISKMGGLLRCATLPLLR
mgnify:FL=1